MTSPAAAPTRRRRAALAITLGVVVVLLIGFFLFAGLYTDSQWFTQLGFQNVLYTEWLTISALFVVGFVTMAVPVAVTIQLAYRLRPVYAKLTAQLDRYQQVIEPLRRVVMLGLPALIGIFAGVSAAARWQPILLLLHGGSVPGATDKQFGMNVGFYLFTLPALHGIVGFASAVLVICGIAAIATAYLYGAIRIAGREIRVSRGARVQIAVTVAIFLVLQAISLYLDQFTTLYEESTVPNVTGAVYADAHAVIPGRLILAAIALLVAVLFVVTAAVGRWRLPLIGSALLVVASVIVGSIFPWAMYNLYVHPSEATLERPYIGRAIDATRDAYGVTKVDASAYDAKTTAQSGALRSDASTTANIRILDPSKVAKAFTQFQGFKSYYKFAPTASQNLDVDRYTIDGTSQDAVVGVRELNQGGLPNQTAYNDTFVYTHGYGLVAAYGNQREDDGSPKFFESNIPSTGDLDITQPRVYFGENSPRFSVVGGSTTEKPIELDYATGTGTGTQVSTTYSGQGGPSVGNFFNRLVYSLKFSSDQILLSSAVNAKSQILYDRNPITRVQKVAPYLTTDQDPYPSVVKGRIVWIVDGYTTSDSYPYSSLQSLSGALANTNTAVAPYATDKINYIRNSVKATVDAYTGKVTLYAWDPSDPVLQTWMRVFPSSVHPLSEMSGDLMSHVRYPEDMFRVQRAILAQYHITDAASWYTSDDIWQTPQEPTNQSGSEVDATGETTVGDRLQPPYYLTMRVPGTDSPTFSLYTTFTLGQTNSGASQSGILTGYLAVDSDAGSDTGTKRSGYGQLRLLELPRDKVVEGPTQVQAQMTSDPDVSQALNLLNRGATQVVLGNLLTIPVGGGLLYVEPVYVQSNAGASYPLLRKVLTSFGNKVAFEDTLSQSLDSLFGGDSGAQTPDSGSGSNTGGGGTSDNGGSTGGTKISAELRDALNDASKALQARQDAYAKNDLVAAATADKQLQDALARAEKAAG